VRGEEMLGGTFYRWRGEGRRRGRGGGAAHRWTAIDGLVGLGAQLFRGEEEGGGLGGAVGCMAH
jgi:hypothetical protein